MTTHVYTRVQHLLHDTNDAFLSCGGSMNTDYAEFASMSINDFRYVLKKPDLKRRDLVRLLRTGMRYTRREDPIMWPIMMAKFIKKSANSNQRTCNKAYNKTAQMR